MKMPGLGIPMPPQVRTYYLTKDNMVPRRGAIKKCNECRIIETRLRGHTVSWLEGCNSPEGKVRGNRTVSYKGDAFSGVVKITQVDIQMSKKLTGKWVGSRKK